MSRLVRLSLPAILSITALLALPALSNAVPGPVAAPIAAPAADGPPAERAREVLADVVAAFSGKPAARSSRPTTDEHGRDVTLLLSDLRAALPALTGDERRTAQTYLARPTDEPVGDGAICQGCNNVKLDGTVETSATAHFLVHYQTSPPLLGRNQVTTPEQLAFTKAILESVWKKEIVDLGFRKPLVDDDEPSSGSAGNPDSKIDVFLVDVGDDGIYGYVNAESNGAQVAPYIVLDNDFEEFQLDPASSLRVTVAHEFFHAIQFAYDASEAPWFTEGTAVWVEDIVYPTINDYFQYLGLSQIARPRQSVNTTGGLERYGAVTFWKYLSEGYQNRGIIRSVWNAADFPQNRNGITAVKDVLSYRGYAWAPAFARSATWATLPVGTYADRKGMLQALKNDGLQPGYWAKVTLGKWSNDTGSARVAINHLASAPLIVYPGSSLSTRAKLRISVDAPSSASWSAARIQVRLKNWKVVHYSIPLNSSGVGARTVGFDRTQVASVVVTLTNARITLDNQSFVVRARIVS